MAQRLTRAEVLDARKWNLDEIMQESDIEIYMAKIRKLIPRLVAFKNKLNPTNAIDYMVLESETSLLLEKVYVFINLKSDEDKSLTKYQELSEKISLLGVELSNATAFFNPTLASFKVKDLQSMRDNPIYGNYNIYLQNLIDNKKHLLNAKQEAILSSVGSFSDDFHNIFTMWDNVDIDMGSIKVDGETIPLTHGSYSQLLRRSDAKVRKEAFAKMYGAYKSVINVLASNYSGNVKKYYFYAQVRKYKNCMDKALSEEDIPVVVYNNLVDSVKKYTPLMHKYVNLRKEALGLKNMHMYDMYLPLVEDGNKLTDYDEAYDMVCEALEPLGEEYGNILRLAKENGWIDVEETASKKSGAYSWGVYGVHPYVLLNHKGTMHDIFTIAHEMGHAMHSYYSNKNQCYEKSNYVIFVAEIASTVNEVLMIKHMLKSAKGKERINLLSYYIDMIRTTLFRQTMFAEFEKFAHNCVENGEPLSAEKLTGYYYELNRTYYGDGVINDKDIGYEWARIPHFYRDFYVYKYATGITTAINIADKIINEPSTVADYKKFLSAGGSMKPIDIIKLVGIDLTKKEPYKIAMQEFENVLSELEIMLKETSL